MIGTLLTLTGLAIALGVQRFELRSWSSTSEILDLDPPEEEERPECSGPVRSPLVGIAPATTQPRIIT